MLITKSAADQFTSIVELDVKLLPHGPPVTDSVTVLLLPPPSGSSVESRQPSPSASVEGVEIQPNSPLGQLSSASMTPSLSSSASSKASLQPSES